MLHEVLDALAVRPGGRYVDATLGLGGHAEAVLERCAPDGRLVGIDADPDARVLATERLRRFGDRVTIVGDNARRIAGICRETGITPVDGVLLDLSVSNLQLGPHGRGFSFQRDAPLDMRMDPSRPLSAAEIVNAWPEEDLARILWEYGEERRSRRVASAIVAQRPLHTTGELAGVVARAVGGHHRIHPATRTFQALRIAVNDELGALREALAGALEVLARPGGRLCVISFHSGEDRIVKQFMRAESAGCVCPPRTPVCVCGQTPRLRLVSRGALRPAPAEEAANPRARSARMRVAERL
jgi:16S rRNA (cytosine1402-N4)-methyltransferase